MKSYIYIICLILCSFSLQGQDHWINYTNNSYVTDVLETNEGLWLSSLGGLCYVNSDTEQETYYNRGNSEIPSNTIYDMLLHPNGDLWLTTSSGICTLNNEQFISGNKRLTGIMRLTPDEKIVVANYDSLYIQTDQMDFESIAYPAFLAEIGGIEIDKQGVIYLNVINFFAETYVAVYKNNQWEIIYSNFIYESAMTMDSNDKIWLVTVEGLQTYNNNVWELVTPIDSIDEFSIGSIFVDKEDNVLIEIKTSCPKLLIWDGTEINEIEFVNGSCQDCHFIKPSTEISSKYYAANRRQGFYSLSTTEVNEFQNYTQSPIYSNSPITTLHPNNGSHYVVFSNNIQLITNGNWSNVSIPPVLASNILHAGLQSDQLWICDKESIYFREDNDWTKIDPPNNFTGDIKFMVIGQNGDVWIQTGTTLARYKNQEWQTFNAGHHDITSGIIKDMVVDPQNGNLWVSTFQGVRKYDGDTWTSYNFPPVDHAFSLAVSEQGVFVRKAGMFLIKEEGIDTIPMPDIGYYGPFESEMVYDLEGQQLFLSGSNHLAVYKNQEWTVYTIENSGVYNGFSYDLKMDTKNNLWLSGSGGGIEIFNAQGVVLSLIDNPNATELPIEVYPTLLKNNEIFIETPIDGIYDLTVYDIQGRILKQDTIHLKSNEVTNYLLPNSNAGTYFVTFRHKNGISTKKVIRLAY